MTGSGSEDGELRSAGLRGLLRKIVSRLGLANLLALAALVVSILAFSVQFGDSRSGDADRAEDRAAAAKADERGRAMLSTSKDIAESVERPDVPSLEFVAGLDEKDVRILHFLADHSENVVRLRLTVPEEGYAPPEPWENLPPEQKKYVPDEPRPEEVTLGCQLQTEGCQTGALAFWDKCPPRGSCVEWYHGVWKIDGYFTVTATEMQMGEMRFALRSVAPEMVRLR